MNYKQMKIFTTVVMCIVRVFSVLDALSLWKLFRHRIEIADPITSLMVLGMLFIVWTLLGDLMDDFCKKALKNQKEKD